MRRASSVGVFGPRYASLNRNSRQDGYKLTGDLCTRGRGPRRASSEACAPAAAFVRLKGRPRPKRKPCSLACGCLHNCNELLHPPPRSARPWVWQSKPALLLSRSCSANERTACRAAAAGAILCKVQIWCALVLDCSERPRRRGVQAKPAVASSSGQVALRGALFH